MHLRLPGLSLLAAGILLSGCSGDEADPGPDAPPPATSSSGPSAVCALTAAEVTAVIGKDAAVTSSTPTRCDWRTADQNAGVVAFSMTAEDWAAALPSLLPQLRLDRRLTPAQEQSLARVQAMVDAGSLDAAQACEAFAIVAPIGGAEQVGGAWANIVAPGQVIPQQGVSAQSCSNGRFASVTAYDAAALPDRALATRAATALGTLRSRLG